MNNRVVLVSLAFGTPVGRTAIATSVVSMNLLLCVFDCWRTIAKLFKYRCQVLTHTKQQLVRAPKVLTSKKFDMFEIIAIQRNYHEIFFAACE